MSRIAEETRTPLRSCTFCREQFNTLYMTWLRGHWFCRDCHRRWIAQHAGPEQFPAGEAPGTFDHLEYLHKADRNIRYGVAVLRFLGYGIALYMALHYSFVADLLHGVVLADILTWVLLCWIDMRFHRWPVVLEFVGFLVLTLLVLNRQQPVGTVDTVGTVGTVGTVDSNAAMGIAFLGFLVTFATKGVYQVHRYWHYGGQDEH